MSISVDEAGTMHETYVATILIGDQPEYFGTVTYDSGRKDLRWSRTSYAFFCPYCGNIWAQIRAVDSKGNTKMFDVWKVSCKHHPDPWNIPGSILARHLINLLDLMPEAVVKREFNLLMEQADD